MEKKVKRIALLSGGGDCPGLNAVIRTITKTAISKYGWEVIGYVYGYRGLYNNNYIELTEEKVENIYKEGGTILFSSNKDNLFDYLVDDGKGGKIKKDGYVYDIQKDAWDKVASVEVDNKAISVYGGNSIKLNEDEMLVIGGFNKEVYDWAVSNLGSLKDQELADFKAKYFGADVAEFKWNNQILVYNAKTNTWRSIGQIPFNAPCGEGLVYAGDSIISINGEVKPGVRSNRIYQGFIVK